MFSKGVIVFTKHNIESLEEQENIVSTGINIIGLSFTNLRIKKVIADICTDQEAIKTSHGIERTTSKEFHVNDVSICER